MRRCGVLPFLAGLSLLLSASRGAAISPIAQADSITPALSPTTGAIIGAVSDSLHDTLLGDAIVTVVQLPLKSAITSNKGFFRIDSLPPGKYTLELSHSILDSLGVRVISDTLDINANTVQMVVMGIPSAQTIVSNVCSPLHQKLGPGVLMGRVLDADSGEPMTGAEISAAWIETRIDAVRGIETGPRVRKDTTAADGSFRLCGVPAGLRGTILATKGNSRTGELTLDAGSDVLVSLRDLRLSSVPQTVVSSPVRDSALRGQATVTGRVTNNGGVPIAGARVAILGSVAEGKTQSDGTFSFVDAPAGSQMIVARKVGYEAVQMPVDISNMAPATVTLRLGEAPVVQLDPVEVKRKRDALAGTGFEQRQKRGDGRYITEAMIDRLQPIYTSDALRRLAGLYVIGSGSATQLYSTRGNGCVNFLIDNHAWNNQGGGQQSIDELVRPEDILGVEYYQSTQVPTVLERSRNSGCALLVVWTRASVKEPK